MMGGWKRDDIWEAGHSYSPSYLMRGRGSDRGSSFSHTSGVGSVFIPLPYHYYVLLPLHTACLW